jgi:hypothetical protein
MAESMFNIYKSLAEENDAPRQAALDYSKIREGGVAAAVMAQSAGMLGGQAMEAMGYQTAPQMQAQAMEEIKALYPNPTTRQDFMGMANEFKNRGMMDHWEKIMGVVDDLAGSTDMKKWNFEQQGKRTAIRREAKRRGYNLTDAEIDDIAISTPLRAKLSDQSGIMVHPWMDTLNAYLSNKTPVTPSDEKPSPSSVITDVAQSADTKALEKMNTSFGVEVKGFRENINTVESGINIVNQVRGGNTASLPQLSRMLAKFNSDNRISVPEVAQVMKIGGLGARITDSIHKFISGDLSKGTLNDIEEMLVRIGQLDQRNYNAKMSQYRVKYGDRFNKKQLDEWLPPSTKQFLTKAQLLEMAKEKLKLRGL